MRFLFLLVACLLTVSLHGQQTSSSSLVEAIEHYQEALGINFAFDSEALNLVSPDRAFDTSSLDRFIQEVEASLPLAIDAVEEKYYTIRPVESTYFLTMTDSIDRQPIPEEIGIYVLLNGQPLPIKAGASEWTFLYKPSLTDSLEVYALGYERKPISFSELINSKVLSVQLSPVVVELSGLTVEDYLTKGIDLNPAHQSVDIAVRDMPLLPGETDGDIFAAITALPGVTTPDGRAGNLFIRGSETDQTLILFDNIPMYHQGHYYGTISPYNPRIVDEVEVYRSGFHPRLGDRVGGAIVIKSAQNPPPKPILGAAANTLYASGYTKIPLADNRIGLSVGARRSYPRKYHSPKLNAISKSVFAGTGVSDDDGNVLTDIEVLFEDYHSKVTFQANDRNHLSFSTIYTNTDVAYSTFPPTDGPLEPHTNQFENLGFNFDWRWQLYNNWASLFSATISDYEFSFTTGDPLNYRAINGLKDINLKQEFSKNPNGSISYQIGLDYKWQSVLTDFLVRNQDTRNTFTFSSSVTSHSLSPYANIEYKGSEKWYAQLGFRSTYYSELNDFKLAPRLLLNYEALDWLTFKASTGWYNQYLSQARNLEFGGGGFENELWVLADGEKGNIIEGTQSMAGFVANKGKWIVDVEAYHKTANNVTVFERRRLEQSRATFTMDQKASGVDVILKRQITDDASLWVGYSHNQSEVKLDTTDRATYLSKYVQPHVWYVGSALKLGNFKLSAAWKCSSGLNAQSLDILFAQVVANEGGGNPPPGNPPPDRGGPPPGGSGPPPGGRPPGGGGNPPPGNRPPPGGQPSSNPFENLPERYPNMYMLDVSASYKIPRTAKRKWETTFGLSVINVFDQSNLTDRVFRSVKGFRDRHAPGFAPNLMVTVEF